MYEEQRATAQAKIEKKRIARACAACANGLERNIQRSAFFYCLLDWTDDTSEFNMMMWCYWRLALGEV